jgi:hypothetical protein
MVILRIFLIINFFLKMPFLSSFNTYMKIIWTGSPPGQGCNICSFLFRLLGFGAGFDFFQFNFL